MPTSCIHVLQFRTARSTACTAPVCFHSKSFLAVKRRFKFESKPRAALRNYLVTLWCLFDVRKHKKLFHLYYSETSLQHNVERSSTIPLSRPSSVANISISRHGELISRASCPLLRNSLLSENCVLDQATQKPGTNYRLLSDKVLTSSAVRLSLNSTAEYETLNSESLTMLPNTQNRLSAATNMWAEDFQDLSVFCQDPDEPSNLTKSITTLRGSSIVPDDELNTPEIGYEEFNFGSMGKQESFDDDKLWDDNPLPKIGFDNYKERCTLDADIADDLPDENNLVYINFDTNVESTLFEERSYISSDTNCQLTEKITDFNEINTQQHVVDISEEKCGLNSSAGMENEVVFQHDVNTATNTAHLPTVTKAKPSKANLHLPLSFEDTGDVLNTPDVLARLGPQPEFDLLKFVLEENNGSALSTPVESSNQPPHAVHVDGALTVKKEVEAEEICVVEENSCNDLDYIIGVPSVSDSGTTDHFLTVVPTKFCVVIKKGDNAEYQVSERPSLKREAAHCDDNSVNKINVDDCEESSSDEEYVPPVKVKKSSSSSKRKSSECSRYRELRDRNNEASRRSRQNRKAKEEETNAQAAVLEAENQKLKIRSEELEKLVDTLRKALLNAMMKGKS